MADSISLLPERIQWWYKLQVESICQKVKEVAKNRLQATNVYTSEVPFLELAEVFDNHYFEHEEAGNMEESRRYFEIARLYSSLANCEEGEARKSVYELSFGLGELVEHFFDAVAEAW